MKKNQTGERYPNCNICLKEAVVYDKYKIFWCAKCALKKQKMSDAKHKGTIDIAI